MHIRARARVIINDGTLQSEILLTLLLCLLALAFARGGPGYYASVVWTPIAAWLPHWLLAGGVAALVATWTVGVWGDLIWGRRVAVSGAVLFWVLIGVVYALGAGSSVSAFFYGGIALIHGFYFWRIWTEVPARPGRANGHPDQ